MNNNIRYFIGISVLVLLQSVFSYGTELLCMSGKSPASVLTFLVTAALIIIILNFLFIYISGRSKLFNNKESALCVFAGVNIYLVLMILVYPHIEVPYALIPKAEMGYSFIQFLNQLFCSAGAVMCWLVSLIWLILQNKKGQSIDR